jgi:hypothetical protein
MRDRVAAAVSPAVSAMPPKWTAIKPMRPDNRAAFGA